MTSSKYSSKSLSADLLQVVKVLQRAQAGEVKLNPDAQEAAAELLNRFGQQVSRIQIKDVQADIPAEHKDAAAESLSSYDAETIAAESAFTAAAGTVLQFIMQVVNRLLQIIPREWVDRMFEGLRGLIERILGGILQPDPDGPEPEVPDPEVPVRVAGYRLMFEDIRLREEGHWRQHRDRLIQLQRRKKEERNFLHPKLLEELNELRALFTSEDPSDLLPHVDDIQDAMFRAIQETLKADTGRDQGIHTAGLYPSQRDAEAIPSLDDDEKTSAAIYGIMLREGITNPELKKRFYDALAFARAEYNANSSLYDSVLGMLREEGRTQIKYTSDQLKRQFPERHLLPDKPDGTWVNQTVFDLLRLGDVPDCETVDKIYVERWASIVQVLMKDGLQADHPYLRARIRAAIENLDGADSDAPPSSIIIDLPDLEQQADVEIIAENLHAMQAIYFAGTLEELRLFQVRDKLIELFQIGMLPVVRGRAGDLLYQQMKSSVTRLSEYERRNLYARTMGMAGGETNGNTNREFSVLWLRFISAVSSFARQMSLDSLLRATVPARVHQEQVRKSGRDLAANLSLYGYGMAYFVATELQTEINEIIALLSDDEIKGSFGARDMWGVVDQVAAMELGGPRDSVRYRTMASAGAVIIRWLANHANELSSVSVGSILDANEIARPDIRSNGTKVTLEPFDSDLVNACERWLAVTGTPEAQVEEYSEPSQSPNMTSRPIQLPSVARDMLESVGINANGFGKY